MPENRPATSSVLELVGLMKLMALSRGNPAVRVGLVDGPVAVVHPALAKASIRLLGPRQNQSSSALGHGTFVAGLLAARGGTPDGICPDCTILSRPIFGSAPPTARGEVVASTADELATAIAECVAAGARVINVSAALAEPSPNQMRVLEQAADLAARRGCLLVVAAGNQGAVGGSALTRHPWVVTVTACGSAGQPLPSSNFATTIGRGGLAAPGDRVTSLAPSGGTTVAGGTSAAAPFVTGAIALIASLLPALPGAAIRYALSRTGMRRRSIVPPLLDAWGAYRSLLLSQEGQTRHGPTSVRPAATSAARG